MRLPGLLRDGRRGLFLRVVANGVAQAGVTIAIAALARHAFDLLAGAGAAPASPHAIALVVSGLVLATAANVTLRVVERQHAEQLAEAYVTQVRLRLYDALTSAPVLTMQRRALGPMMLRFVTDLTAVRQWVSNGLARLVIGGLAMIGGLTAIAITDPVIGAVVGTIFLAAGGVAFVLGVPLERTIRRTRRRRSRLAAQIADRLQALHVVQLSGQVRRERRAIRRRSLRLAEAAVARARLVSIARTLPEAALGFATVAVLVIGAHRIEAGLGGYGAIIASITVLGALSPPLRGLGRVFEYWKNYRVATGKLREVISGTTRLHARRKVKEPERIDGRIAFDHASVRGILNEITACAEPRTLIAVTGPSGAGKSSLLAAAGRLLALDAGEIRLDGENIADITDPAFARHVAMVSPDLPLLETTIRRNLTYRFPEAAEEDIEAVCELCELKHEIARLPKGLETRVTERASRLPLGLRQRLRLARAVIGNPAVLLLDTPEACLDPVGRAVLSRLLRARRHTILLVTHDGDWIRMADALWHLENGHLRESGPPDTLLSNDGPASRFLASDRVEAPSAASAKIAYLGARRPIRD